MFQIKNTVVTLILLPFQNNEFAIVYFQLKSNFLHLQLYLPLQKQQRTNLISVISHKNELFFFIL